VLSDGLDVEGGARGETQQGNVVSFGGKRFEPCKILVIGKGGKKTPLRERGNLLSWQSLAGRGGVGEGVGGKREI